VVSAPQNLIGGERCYERCLTGEKQDAEQALPEIFGERVHAAERQG